MKHSDLIVNFRSNLNQQKFTHMKILSYLSFLLFAVAIIACGPGKQGEDAEVSEAKEVEEVEASTEYTIATDASTVGWIGSKPTGKHNGTIPITGGTIATEDGAIVGGTIELSVADIKNDDLAENADMQKKLLDHLKSADFFHADSFPTAQFVITSVTEYTEADKPQGKEQFDTENKPVSADQFMVEAPTHKITGNLTMRGKTLSISFPASVMMEEGKVMAKAKFNIDRTNWGLMYGDEASVVDKAKDKFIYNTVNVSFDITANEQQNM